MKYLIILFLSLILYSCQKEKFQDERLVPYWKQTIFRDKPYRNLFLATPDDIGDLLDKYKLDIFYGLECDKDIYINLNTFNGFTNYNNIYSYQIQYLMDHEVGHSVGLSHSKPGQPEWADPGMEPGIWITIDSQEKLDSMRIILKSGL